MKILIVTPARPGSTKGNRVTADRWAKFCRLQGHVVAVVQSFTGQPSELLIALHAIKSAASIRRFRRERPACPIVLMLTGTDLYHPIDRSRAGMESLELADRIVILQSDGYQHLPSKCHSKTEVIVQSAESFRSPPPKLTKVFEVIVIGHVRAVKDPFRAALAARRLPADSRIQVVHMGQALTESMQRRALSLNHRINRYRWLGVLPRWKALRRLARGRLMVISSISEGGAGVVSESLALNVPMLASRVSGNVGILGEKYPGLFDFGSTGQLANLMERAETDHCFYQELRDACQTLRPLVAPEREAAAIERLIRCIINK